MGLQYVHFIYYYSQFHSMVSVIKIFYYNELDIMCHFDGTIHTSVQTAAYYEHL